MRRSLLTRLGRLEREHARASAGPLLIVSSTTLPDQAPTAEIVQDWLNKGWARRCAGARHVVFYDRGRPPMTIGQWQAKHGKGLLG
jgi:hypothetical protein